VGGIIVVDLLRRKKRGFAENYGYLQAIQATCITGRKTRDLSNIIIFVWTSHRFSILITNF
jgi:hypothetical protein